MANSVIGHLKIAKEDIVILVGRGYKPYPTQEKLKIVLLDPVLNKISRVSTNGTPLFWLRNWRKLCSIDQILKVMTAGQPFEVYLPSNRNYLMQYIATHPKCKALKLLEEGTMSYRSDIYKNNNINFDRRINKVRHWFKWLDHGGRSTYYIATKKKDKVIIFGFHDALSAALTGSELSVNIFPLLPNLSNDERPKYHLPNGTILFIMDPLLERGFADAVQLKLALVPFLNSLLPDSTVYFKWHPDQTDTSTVVEIFKKKGIRIHEIPSNQAVELLLLNSDDLQVIGFYSSLLLYAKLLGHRSMSLYPFLENLSSKAASWRLGAMPKIFQEQVSLFNLRAIS